jgi:DNA modification methylase
MIYYSDDAVTLYHGDCLDILPQIEAADHVIIDPAYSAHVHNQNRRGLTAHAGVFSERRDLGFDSLKRYERRAFARYAARLARRWVLVFSDTESDYLWRGALQGAGAEYVRTCFWEKVGGAPQFTGDRPAVAYEAVTAVTLCHAPSRKHWNGGGRQGVYKHPIVVARGGRNEARVHSTQKPLSLMCELIGDFTDEGDTVLDFTAGSGTTGVAAKLNGRKAILIEKSEAYCEVAATRLRKAEPGRLFDNLPRAKAQRLPMEVSDGA